MLFILQVFSARAHLCKVRVLFGPEMKLALCIVVLCPVEAVPPSPDLDVAVRLKNLTNRPVCALVRSDPVQHRAVRDDVGRMIMACPAMTWCRGDRQNVVNVRVWIIEEHRRFGLVCDRVLSGTASAVDSIFNA